MTVSCSSSFYLKDYFQIKEKNKLLFSSFLDWFVFRDANEWNYDWTVGWTAKPTTIITVDLITYRILVPKMGTLVPRTLRKDMGTRLKNGEGSKVSHE